LDVALIDVNAHAERRRNINETTVLAHIDAVCVENLVGSDIRLLTIEIDDGGIAQQCEIAEKLPEGIARAVIIGDVEAVRPDRDHIIERNESVGRHAAKMCERAPLTNIENLDSLGATCRVVDRKEAVHTILAFVEADAMRAETFRYIRRNGMKRPVFLRLGKINHIYATANGVRPRRACADCAAVISGDEGELALMIDLNVFRAG